MALVFALTETNVGVAAPQAYAKIVAFRSNYLQGNSEVAVDIFFDAAARTAGKSPVDGGVYVVPADAGIPADPTRADLYAWLKTLPKFAGAVDV